MNDEKNTEEIANEAKTKLLQFTEDLASTCSTGIAIY